MVILLVSFLAEGRGTLMTKQTKGNTTTEYSDSLVIAGLALVVDPASRVGHAVSSLPVYVHANGLAVRL